MSLCKVDVFHVVNRDFIKGTHDAIHPQINSLCTCYCMLGIITLSQTIIPACKRVQSSAGLFYVAAQAASLLRIPRNSIIP